MELKWAESESGKKERVPRSADPQCEMLGIWISNRKIFLIRIPKWKNVMDPDPQLKNFIDPDPQIEKCYGSGFPMEKFYGSESTNGKMLWIWISKNSWTFIEINVTSFFVRKNSKSQKLLVQVSWYLGSYLLWNLKKFRIIWCDCPFIRQQRGARVPGGQNGAPAQEPARQWEQGAQPLGRRQVSGTGNYIAVFRIRIRIRIFSQYGSGSKNPDPG